MLTEVVDGVSESTMDGAGKRIFFLLDNMGAIKQAPALIKHTREVLPNVDMSVFCYDLYGMGSCPHVLERDLKRIDPRLLKDLQFHPYLYDDRAHLVVRDMVKHADRGNTVGIEESHTSQHAYKEFTASGNKLRLWIEPLKFEDRPLATNEDLQAMLEKYKITPGTRIVVAGSISSREVLPFCAAIKAEIEKSRYLIVLRGDQNACMAGLRKTGVAYNTDENLNGKFGNAPTITAITEPGVLQDLYAICDVAFIGDSLWTTDKNRGQNPLEPAFYSKRIVSGTHVGNNLDAFSGLEKSGLLTKVRNQQELETALHSSPDPAVVQQWALQAKEFILQRQGAAQRYALKIKEMLYAPMEEPDFKLRFLNNFI